MGSAPPHPQLLLLYGSLRRGEPMFQQLGLGEALEFVSELRFAGELYDLGDYPGAVRGDGSVAAELYRVKDPSIFEALDRYEEFDPAKPAESLFVRRRVPLDGCGDAWVYLFNGKRDAAQRIASGDWRKHRSAA